MGIEDENFIELWKEAMTKTSKWLMNRTVDQSELHAGKMKIAYSEALTKLNHVSTSSEFEKFFEKIDLYKRQKFDFFLGQREERQKRSADKSEMKFKQSEKEKSTPKDQRKNDQRPRDGRMSGQNRYNDRKSRSRERSTSRHAIPSKKSRDDKWKSDYTDDTTCPNPRYLGRNYDPNYRAKKRGGKQQDLTSYRNDKRRERDYERDQKVKPNRKSDKNNQEATTSQQDLFKKFLDFMQQKK
jgi:hypothetical protein